MVYICSQIKVQIELKVNEEENQPKKQYEVILGGYCNVAVCVIGLMGNLLSLAVLFRKEMKQKNNTFNNLLIGELGFELVRKF